LAPKRFANGVCSGEFAISIATRVEASPADRARGDSEAEPVVSARLATASESWRGASVEDACFSGWSGSELDCFGFIGRFLSRGKIGDVAEVIEMFFRDSSVGLANVVEFVEVGESFFKLF
jgi:hypothetical protein